MLGFTSLLFLTAACSTFGSRIISFGRRASTLDRTDSPSSLDSGTRGKVANLYAVAAPKVSFPSLRTRAGGCFPGYHITAWGRGLLMDTEDIVSNLPPVTGHTFIRKLGISVNGLKHEWGCHQWPIRLTHKDMGLHDPSVYADYMAKLPRQYQRAKEGVDVCMAISYAHDKTKARIAAERMRWRLVGRAQRGEDVSNLVQDPKTKRCILTFEGTDSLSDVVTDLNFIPVPFCGLPAMVHFGFRNELMRMVDNDEWQNNIRQKLGKCSSVDVTGFSLGGAVATLFTACVEHHRRTRAYNKMSWTAGRRPVLMPSI